MTEPLETRCKIIIRQTAAGVKVGGLGLSDFSILAVYRPNGGVVTAWSHSSTIVDIEAVLGASYKGWYAWIYTTPPQGDVDCGADIQPASGTDQIYFPKLTGEMEPKDLLSIFNVANRPQVTLSGQGTIGQVTPITMVAHRRQTLTFSFVDAAGDPVDMTDGVTYTNFRFSTRSKTDQTAAAPKMDQSTGITAADGSVSVAILEAASFYSVMPEGAAVEDSLELRYELVADLVAEAGETVSLVQSSPLTLLRRENGTG